MDNKECKGGRKDREYQAERMKVRRKQGHRNTGRRKRKGGRKKVK